MTNKHTPGPWRIGKHYGAVVADHPVPEMSGSDHVQAYGGHMVGESIAPRNRPLIAAAPEMFDLLKEFQAFVRDGNHFGYPLGSVQKLDELIAKASAEAP